MSMEPFFRIAFWSIFGGMIALQAYYALRLRLAGEHRAADPKAIEWGGWVFPAVRGIRSILLLAFLVLYAIQPPWFGMLSIPFPAWLRWVGVTPGVFSLALYVWSRQTLGKEWSSCLQIRQKKHRLITTGPYAWIRHPIYLAMMSLFTGLTLVAANWALLVFLVISIVDLGLRIPREERMMIEAFGDEYKAYAQRTGRIFPT